VLIASPTPSGIEWQTWKNSMGFAGLDGVQAGLGLRVAIELGFQQGARQGRGVDRRPDLVQHVVDGAGVVLVSVGDDDGAHLVLLVAQVAEIRDDVVDPEHVVLGEHDPGVDDDDGVPRFEGHHVLADLSQSSERDPTYGGVRHTNVPQDVLHSLRARQAAHPRRRVCRPGWVAQPGLRWSDQAGSVGCCGAAAGLFQGGWRWSGEAQARRPMVSPISAP